MSDCKHNGSRHVHPATIVTTDAGFSYRDEQCLVCGELLAVSYDAKGAEVEAVLKNKPVVVEETKVEVQSEPTPEPAPVEIPTEPEAPATDAPTESTPTE